MRSVRPIDTEVGFRDTEFYWEFTNVRAEFASLNYGAEIRLRYCFESPFAYYSNTDLDVTIDTLAHGISADTRCSTRWELMMLLSTSRY